MTSFPKQVPRHLFLIAALASPRFSGIGPPVHTLVMHPVIQICNMLKLATVGFIGPSHPEPPLGFPLRLTGPGMAAQTTWFD